ncbi:MAG: hypothetical protein ABI306_01955 [Caulobacteraceae bacterium]
MRISVGGALTWIVAVAAVGSLYAHTFIDAPASATTPVLACAIAAGLVALAVGGLARFRLAPAERGARRISAGLLALALAGFAASTLVGLATRGMGAGDWGVFALQAGTPILLSLTGRRVQLLRALGWVCIVFASVDAAANLAAFAHAIDLPAYSGRLTEGGVRLRYPGLSGNSLAAGLVAFTAVAFLAAGVGGRMRWALAARIALIGALFASLYLIDARRYLTLAALAVPLLGFRPAWRIPPAAVAVGLGAAGLAAAFAETSDLRARLVIGGAARALAHPLLGQGPTWRDPASLQPLFASLHGAGVTESGLLDLSIAYGVPATALLVLASLTALSARRPAQSLPAVILALLTAELAFGDSLSGFLGAILFYAALIACQRDEPFAPIQEPNHAPSHRSRRNQARWPSRRDDCDRRRSVER